MTTTVAMAKKSATNMTMTLSTENATSSRPHWDTPPGVDGRSDLSLFHIALSCALFPVNAEHARRRDSHFSL